MSENLKTAAVIALLLIAYGIVGTLDYQDAIAQEAALNAERNAWTWANCARNGHE
jgi:Tfp pilus assembly protein PilV